VKVKERRQDLFTAESTEDTERARRRI
jgi:hypothetical protein